MSLHATRNDLPTNAKQVAIALLKARLADAIDLRLATKHAHWNVKGPQFISLHEMFDTFVVGLDEHIDTMAERITALGGTALGTTQQVMTETKLPAYPVAITAGADHLKELIARYGALANTVRRNIDEAAEAGEADTADVFTGLSRALDKNLWFLEAHVQSDR
jgi:starvation-inducible DNA-binding protein